MVGDGYASQHGEAVTVDGDVGDGAGVEFDLLENRVFVRDSGDLDRGCLSGPGVSGSDLEQVVAAHGYAVDGPSEKDFCLNGWEITVGDVRRDELLLGDGDEGFVDDGGAT